MKVMHIRLPDEQAFELEIASKLDNTTMVNIMRKALRLYIKQRCTDNDFRRRLQREIDKNKRMLNES